MLESPSFDILNRNLPIYRHHVLEASAGTGKTYSIENLVVRLLVEAPVEGQPCALSEILVVTFTRAATRELKARIRENIQFAIHCLREGLSTNPVDYLKAILEQGEASKKQAIRRLQQALHTFDEAQIYTIHGFCARALAELPQGAVKEVQSDEKRLSQLLLYGVIEDVFRSECTSDELSGAQLALVLGKHRGSSESLRNSLLKSALGTVSFEKQENFSQLYHQFTQVMQGLRQTYCWTTDGLKQDFFQLQSRFKAYDTKKRWMLPEHIDFFCSLFARDEWTPEDLEKLIYEDLLYTVVLHPSQKKARAKEVPAGTLKHPEAVSTLLDTLAPLIQRARDTERIYAHLAYLCQQGVRRFLEEEELSAPDSLLQEMMWAVEEEEFCRQYSQKYRFAIVDEFQDTDPAQWKVIEKLFLHPESSTYLALVGDPKQAIYAFRDADIYTYMQAVNTLPREAHATLAVNYRSAPELIEGVNFLFGHEYNPELLLMPRTEEALHYHPIHPAPHAKSSTLSDGKGAIHFLIAHGSIKEAERSCFLPFMCTEIQRLVDEQGRHFRDIAVLIRHRNQASDVYTALSDLGIPALMERAGHVTETPAYPALIELIDGMLHPRNHSALLQAFSGPYIRWSHQLLEDWVENRTSEEIKRRVLQQVYRMRSVLQEHGIGQFAEDFLSSSWNIEGKSVLQTLLSSEGGDALYRDFQHLVDLMSEKQTHIYGAESLLHNLLQLEQLQREDDESSKLRSDGGADAVRIMTMHISKGLEFPIVFALGVDQRTSSKQQTRLLRTQTQIEVVEDDEHKDLYLQRLEEDSEKLRQAYVALTRAKERVYVPFPVVANSGTVTPGTPSPIELLLAKFAKEESLKQNRYDAIAVLEPGPLMRMIDRSKERALSYEVIQEGQYQPSPRPSESPEPLFEPQSVEVYAPPLLNQSFSSITHLFEGETDPLSLPAPNDWYADNQTIHTLPAGVSTGLLLHSILEKIPYQPFADAGQESLMKLIRPYLLQPQERLWEDTLVHLLKRVLTAPLRLPTSKTLRLCDIPTANQCREMEFLYRVSNGANHVSARDGYMKGYIDLIFSYEEQFYIVDWKSNWLGLGQDDYSPDQLEMAMRRHHYHLQAQIYQEAFERHLAACGIRSTDSPAVAGVFYLFLRGMDGQSSSGIYTCHPQMSQICPD